MADLSIVYDRMSADPLDGADLKAYYINLFAGRGDNPILPLKRRLENSPAGKLQILFSGYRGCGKSTELNKLKSEIQHEFIVLHYSVLHELDPININYVELFIITMEKLFGVAETEKVPISNSLLRSVQAWVESEEIQKVRDLSVTTGMEAGADAEFSVPWFVKFFAKIRFAGNASFSNKRTITETIEHRLSDLITHCNDLIREIKLKLSQVGKKGLLVIIEDMDKLSLEKSEELFFRHSHILTSLEANVIFTLPVSLRYHPNATTIKGNFDEDFELPMVKVSLKNGSPNPEGREGLLAILESRIGLACFETPAVAESFIAASGGCLRDLFRMVRDAADNALNENRDVILKVDYKKAFLKLKRDYENTIADKVDEDNKVITGVKTYFDVLVAVAKSETKKVDNTAAALDLRQNLCLLGYNDEGWCDVHPVVKEILKERKLI
ncbi:MAG: P-loop NTPase fold protein [Saprospiraceae bacterium]